MSKKVMFSLIYHLILFAGHQCKKRRHVGSPGFRHHREQHQFHTLRSHNQRKDLFGVTTQCVGRYSNGSVNKPATFESPIPTIFVANSCRFCRQFGSVPNFLLVFISQFSFLNVTLQNGSSLVLFASHYACVSMPCPMPHAQYLNYSTNFSRTMKRKRF